MAIMAPCHFDLCLRGMGSGKHTNNASSTFLYILLPRWDGNTNAEHAVLISMILIRYGSVYFLQVAVSYLFPCAESFKESLIWLLLSRANTSLN